jgi:hypothetical protein
MAEIIWKIGFDQSQAKQAGKSAGKAQSKESSSGGGGGAFAGGVVGGLLGSLLSSVKMLFDPLSAIASLLVAALFPLLKPFLVLFLKVGILLFNWLNDQFAKGGGVEGGMLGRLVDGLTGQGDTFVDKLVNTLAVGTFVTGLIAALIGGAGFVKALVAGLVLTGAFNIGLWLGDKLADLVVGTFNFGRWLATKMIDLIVGTFNFGVWLGEKIADIVIGTFNIGKWLGKNIADFIVGKIDAVKDMWSWFTQNLFGDDKIDINTQVWGFIKGLFKGGINVGTTVWNWFKGLFKGSLLGGDNGSTSSMEDGIITPNGDMIRTSPNDYLIATKTPSSLFGGSGGSGSSNINVTINGGLITEDVARDIGRMIQRELNLGGRM